MQVAKLEARCGAQPLGRRQTAGDSLGLTVEPLTPQMANRLEVPRDMDGVVVTDVDPAAAPRAPACAKATSFARWTASRYVAGRVAIGARRRRNRPSLMLVQRGATAFFATVPVKSGTFHGSQGLELTTMGCSSFSRATCGRQPWGPRCRRRPDGRRARRQGPSRSRLHGGPGRTRQWGLRWRRDPARRGGRRPHAPGLDGLELIERLRGRGVGGRC